MLLILLLSWPSDPVGWVQPVHEAWCWAPKCKVNVAPRVPSLSLQLFLPLLHTHTHTWSNIIIMTTRQRVKSFLQNCPTDKWQWYLTRSDLNSTQKPYALKSGLWVRIHILRIRLFFSMHIRIQMRIGIQLYETAMWLLKSLLWLTPSAPTTGFLIPFLIELVF